MKPLAVTARGLAALLIGLVITTAASVASAQVWGDESPAPPEAPPVEREQAPAPAPQPPAAPAPDEPVVRKAADDPQKRAHQIRESTNRQLQSGQGTIHIYQLVEEMVDELIADLSDLNPKVTSPLALRNMGLSPNLSAAFGHFVESTIVSAIANSTHLTIKRCVACHSLRSRVENDDWVVSMGLTHHEDLQREAARIGVVTFLDARLAYFPGANIVALQVELYRAGDGAVLWSETYRSDATTAAILRSGDRVIPRGDRVRELERKLDARPYYGHLIYGGATYIPYDSPLGGLSGASFGYRLYEKFGEDRRKLFGIGAEAFANFSESGLLGSFIYGTLQYELFAPNLNSPVYRTGPAIGGFFAGTEGNSYFVEWGFEAVMQFRLGAGASVFYFVPTEFAGYDLGGFGAKARAMFNW